MKKFYTAVGVTESGIHYSVLLDGKPIRTPAKNELLLPTKMLAELVAAEWDTELEILDTSTMYMTRLANTTIDWVLESRVQLIEEVTEYINTDLVCHRAWEPEVLRKRQAVVWDPLVFWFNGKYGVDLTVTTELLPVAQPSHATGKVKEFCAGLNNYALAALHQITTMCGSIVIGLAVADEELDGVSAWSASLIDEFYQLDKWGVDSEVTERHDRLRREIEAATRFLNSARLGC